MAINIDLKNKTVLIVAADRTFARHLKEELEVYGTKVVFSQHAPHHPDSVPKVLAEVEKNKPDAVVIHNPGFSLEESQKTCMGIATDLQAKAIPLVVQDNHKADKFGELGRMKRVRCFGHNSEYRQIAFAISEMTDPSASLPSRPLC